MLISIVCVAAVPPSLDAVGAGAAPQGATTSSVPTTVPPTTAPPAPTTTPTTVLATTTPPTTAPPTTVVETTAPATTTSPTTVPATEPPPPPTSSTTSPPESTTTEPPVTAPLDPDDTESATQLPELHDEREIVFPLVGHSQQGDGFNDCTNNCTTFHKGIDLLAEKLQPVVSPVDGVVAAVLDHPAAGVGVVIRDADGYEYRLYHLNNDSPFTDDDVAAANWRLGPGISPGAAVAPVN